MDRGPLTEDELAAIRNRERRASPGMWFPVREGSVDGLELHLAWSMNSDRSKWTYQQLAEHDIEFLRHCRDDVTRLLTTIDALMAQRDSWRNSTNQVLNAFKDTFLNM